MFIVKAHSGDYEGSYDWPIAAFKDRESAVLFLCCLTIKSFRDEMPGCNIEGFAVEAVNPDGSIDEDYVVEVFSRDRPRTRKGRARAPVWDFFPGKDF